MDTDIRTIPPLRLAAVTHTGAYHQIGPAFKRLGSIAGPAGLFTHPDAIMMGVYKDDPTTTPVERLRSAAAVVILEGARVPAALVEERLLAGRFACFTHVGSYEGLPSAWKAIQDVLMAASRLRRRAGPSYERYLNDPSQVQASELRTEICIPVE
jgi:AraC family transcriptional regulator